VPDQLIFRCITRQKRLSGSASPASPQRPPGITPSPLGSLINPAVIAALVLIARRHLTRRPDREADKSF